MSNIDGYVHQFLASSAETFRLWTEIDTMDQVPSHYSMGLQ